MTSHQGPQTEPLRYPMLELETTVSKTIGTLDLLAMRLIGYIEAEGTAASGECAAGIAQIAYGASKELRAAYDRAHEDYNAMRRAGLN